MNKNEIVQCEDAESRVEVTHIHLVGSVVNIVVLHRNPFAGEDKDMVQAQNSPSPGYLLINCKAVELPEFPTGNAEFIISADNKQLPDQYDVCLNSCFI